MLTGPAPAEPARDGDAAVAEPLSSEFARAMPGPWVFWGLETRCQAAGPLWEHGWAGRRAGTATARALPVIRLLED